MKRAALLLFGMLAIFFTNHANAQHSPFDPQFAFERTTNGFIKISFYFPSGPTWQVQVTTEDPVLRPGRDPWQSMRKPYFESFELGPNRITYLIDPKKYPKLFLRAFEMP